MVVIPIQSKVSASLGSKLKKPFPILFRGPYFYLGGVLRARISLPFSFFAGKNTAYYQGVAENTQRCGQIRFHGSGTAWDISSHGPPLLPTGKGAVAIPLQND